MRKNDEGRLCTHFIDQIYHRTLFLKILFLYPFIWQQQRLYLEQFQCFIFVEVILFEKLENNTPSK